MKASFSFLLTAFLSVSLPLCAADPDGAGVNTHCYEFTDNTYTPAPAGYELVYLSHYGRHGARTSMKVTQDYEDVISTLKKASRERNLTAQGDSLLNESIWVNEYYLGRNGALTRRGEAEQHELARRIYAQYKPVFAKGSKYVRVQTSTVPRSIVSGECFVQTLTSLQRDLHFTFDTAEKFFAFINNDCSEPNRAAVMVLRDSINALNINDGTWFMKYAFKNPEKAADSIGDADAFQFKVWKLAREGRASGLDVNMFRHLPEEVIAKWTADEIRNIYLRNGNSVEFGEERMKLAQPLISVMLSQACDALATGTVAADLKFGHDYPLVATAGYFGIEGVGDRLSINDLPEKWSDPMYIPFSSNMQMAFYRNKEGNVLVKFVYNGKECTLRDLKAVSGPYYSWNDILEKFLPDGDERTFRLAQWDWKPVGDGAFAGHANLKLFGVNQSISVLRYSAARFKTCLANDNGEAADSTAALALRHGGIAAINASYFNMRTLYPTTFTKDDGKQEGWTTPDELIRVDGAVALSGKKVSIIPCDTVSCYSLTKKYKEVLAAGPVLMLDGQEARQSWPNHSFFTWRHPRTFIGTTSDGWVYLVVIDGRFKEGAGTTIHETAEIARMLGLRDALNLDGGGSSVLWTKEHGTISYPFDNHRYDHFGQRVVPNIIYIK
ncbi:MAG: phosphodiester glycosidase family protein [Bacteroidales bacterium]|nr:phosphodiester glycosidase family protein [Bacteroidales bacterium]